MDDLLVRTTVRATDTPEAAAVKQDARMARVLATALNARIRKPTEPITVPDGSYRFRITPEALRRVVDDVRREAPSYATGRERVRARVVALLQRQAEYRRGDSPGEAWLRRMGRHKEVTGFLDAVWPAVTAEELVFEVLSTVDDGVLTAQEAATMRRVPGRSARTARWTAADAVLIDEAAGLIDRVPSYGHVILDEAQDLSPMQCRAIARRSEHGSITLLGDLAQGTAPWAARDWRETLTHLGKPDARVVPLTTGFRVPEVVLALANRLLPALGVEVPTAVSLRRDGALAVRPVSDVDSATVAAVRAALDHDGSVGVIAAVATVARLRAALHAAGVATADPEDVDSPERVTVLPATLAKGLEYDHVVVVEPADIVAAEPRGLHRLYVVLTRAVSRLDVLHSAPLPGALQSSS